MRKGSLQLTAIALGVLVVVVVGLVFYSGSVTGDSTPTPTKAATPASGLTVTYSELSRNQTMIVILFKLEPNSYIFQMNATSFHLTEGGARISANTNSAVIIGTQYSILYFPINGYNGTDYRLSSDALPTDTVWIKQ